MVYSKAPNAYYSTLHDSITSACKAILPFGLKKRFLMSTEHRLSKLQSDNLKWQQDSFRQILNLMGLQRDDILPESEVSAFRTHLLDTLLASNPDQDHPAILRDKLLFLQDLLYAQCISEGEYNFSRRPLIQKLAAQGAEVEARDVIDAGTKYIKQNSEEEWSVIDLKDEQCLANKENSNFNKSKQARKKAKGAKSIFGFVSPYKPGNTMMEKTIFDSPYLHTNGSGRSNENPSRDGTDKVKRKPFRNLFHGEKREGRVGGGHGLEPEMGEGNSAKKQWGFDGLMKWKKSDQDDETVPLPLNERSDSDAHSSSYQLFTRSLGKDADTKLANNGLHSDETFSQISLDDKVSEDNIKKEHSKIQTKLRSTNPNLKFFSRCDRYGNVELDVVKKEFKDDHVGQMQNIGYDADEKRENSMGWTKFEDDENHHPNLIVHHSNSLRGNSIIPFSHGYAASK